LSHFVEFIKREENFEEDLKENVKKKRLKIVYDECENSNVKEIENCTSFVNFIY
jgi:hypothetical protein